MGTKSLKLSLYWLFNLVLFSLLWISINADEVGSIVYGSFSKRSTAVAARAQFEVNLDESLEITPVIIGGTTYYRVHGTPKTDIESLRVRLEEVRVTIARDAWLLKQTIEPAPISDPVARKGAAVAQRKSLEQATPKLNTLPSHFQTTKPDKENKKTPVVQSPAFTQATGGGVDATLKPLVIPKFENSGVNVNIDGRLDEAVWNQVAGYDNMTIVEPDTLNDPEYETLTRLFYTDDGLYVGTSAKQPGNNLLARLSSRDKDINRDGTVFYLDTSGDGLYGLFFGVNLGGSLVDGTMLPERQISSLWDGPWEGDADSSKDGYTTEMFLPWSMMSMPEAPDVRKMNFGVTRRVAHLDEQWSWPALPRSRPRFMSALQPMLLENVIPRQQLAFYPFIAGTRNRIEDETSYRAGTDIFWRPSSNLQLTATVNPDFGTVESDDVVVNLTAFETFFAEKRLFFLEGSEIFVTSPRAAVRGPESSTGARQVPNSFSLQPNTLVNTRRIGGAARPPVIPLGVTIPDVELSKPSELAGAMKVTGQQGAFRYGVMAAFEEDTKFYGSLADGTPTRLEQDGRNFKVLRFLYEDAGDGRHSIGWLSTLVQHPEEDAKTHGLDFHYLSSKSRLVADGQLVYSDINDIEGKGGFVNINYIPQRGRLHRFSYDYFDDKLDVSDLGFFRRNDVITYRYSYNRQTSKLKSLRFKMDWLTFSHETNTDDRMVRSYIYYRNTLTFNSRNQLNTTLMYRPKQWDDKTSEENGDFRTHEGGIAEFAYGTDTSKKFSASLGINGMTEALGDWSYIAKGGITFKPNDRFSFDLDFMYRRANDWIVHLAGSTLGAYKATHWQPGIAMESFITSKQQLRFSLQWVGIKADATNLYQVPVGDGELIEITNGMTDPAYDFTISRVTAQIRYRWEIAPLSDLFIVYTRGSNLPNRQEDEFGNLFNDAVTEPIIDKLVIKLRYRFGN